MAGTKVEVKMKKAEPGSWSKLFFPREVSSFVNFTENSIPYSFLYLLSSNKPDLIYTIILYLR